MHNYKKDCADIFPGIRVDWWMYYIMDNGTMTGTGVCRFHLPVVASAGQRVLWSADW